MNTSRTSVTLLFTLLSIGLIAIGCDAQGRKSTKAVGNTPVKQAPEPAIAARLLGKNLIVNGSAEAPDTSAWHSEDLKTIVYGEFGGGPMKDSPGPANRGEKYFYANMSTRKPIVSFSQKVDIKGLAAAIDKGAIQYDADAWFGGTHIFSVGRLVIVFTGDGGTELGTATTDRKDRSDRQNDLDLVERSANGTVPAGTRGLTIKLEFYIPETVTDDQVDTLGYADNLSFVMTEVK
jgi:hypothetical protein